MSEPGKKFYICDPNKNTTCAGRFQPHCGVQCFCTTVPALSSDPEHALTTREYRKEQQMRMASKPRIIF